MSYGRREPDTDDKFFVGVFIALGLLAIISGIIIAIVYPIQAIAIFTLIVLCYLAFRMCVFFGHIYYKYGEEMSLWKEEHIDPWFDR